MYDDIGQYVRGVVPRYAGDAVKGALPAIADIKPGESVKQISLHTLPLEKTKGLVANVDLARFGMTPGHWWSGYGNEFLRFEIPIDQIREAEAGTLGITKWGEVARVGRVEVKLREAVIEYASVDTSYPNLKRVAQRPALVLYWEIQNRDERAVIKYEESFVLRPQQGIILYDDVGQIIPSVDFGVLRATHVDSMKSGVTIATGQTAKQATCHAIPPKKVSFGSSKPATRSADLIGQNQPVGFREFARDSLGTCRRIG